MVRVREDDRSAVVRETTPGTHQIIRARCDRQTITFYVALVDTAVDFAAWLTRGGYRVEMFDGVPDAYPRTPSEEDAAEALEQLYVRSLPR